VKQSPITYSESIGVAKGCGNQEGRHPSPNNKNPAQDPKETYFQSDPPRRRHTFQSNLEIAQSKVWALNMVTIFFPLPIWFSAANLVCLLERFILLLGALRSDLLADHSVRWDVVPPCAGTEPQTAETRIGETPWHTST
jgi:hypothetical protein